jgi:hypothetical protein
MMPAWETGATMQGTGLGQPYGGVAETRAAPAPRRPAGPARRLAVALLALLGLGLMGAGLVQLALAGHRAVEQLKQVGTTTASQRFAFDREAWRAIRVDDLFPPRYSLREATSEDSARRDLVRVAVPAPTGCPNAFDPALAQLLAGLGCGPVLQADYTDATQTLVATVGVAFLHGSDGQQQQLSLATRGAHDDLRPRPFAAPGSAAASFGEAQRLAAEVHAPSDEPYLFFAVIGFADGRPAGADPGPDAAVQSGAQLLASELELLVLQRTESAVGTLWARRPA